MHDSIVSIQSLFGVSKTNYNIKIVSIGYVHVAVYKKGHYYTGIITSPDISMHFLTLLAKHWYITLLVLFPLVEISS